MYDKNLLSIQEEGDLRQTRAAAVDGGHGESAEREGGREGEGDRGERTERGGGREGEAMDVDQCLTDSERKSQSEEEGGAGERRRERRASLSSSSSRQVSL